MTQNEVIPEEDHTENKIIRRDDFLLDLLAEENRHCHDLRKMNNVITRCFSALQSEVSSEASQLPQITPRLMETIGLFLKGKELHDAEGMLIADLESLSKEILKKIKKGIYKIAESKQIDGNMRAVVVDDKGTIIKQITLKHAAGNDIVAGDMNTLAIQAVLRQITKQLQGIEAGVEYLIAQNRQRDYQKPFFVALRNINDAKMTTVESERIDSVKGAIKELKDGLEGLYMDLSANIEKLKGRWRPVASYKYLQFIAEDMVFIPQYVALLSYLFNYIRRPDFAMDRIQFYCEEINNFVNIQIYQGYTAAQLVHSHYHYTEQNRDFWIDGMNRIQSKMSEIGTLITDRTHEKAVYYLSFEDIKEENNRCLEE